MTCTSSQVPAVECCIDANIRLSEHRADFINSLAPGKFEWNFRYVIFKQILVIDGWGISCEIALIWMSLDITDDQSTLVQVMAWCRQATSHYLSQCWPRSLSPYGVTRPHWVKDYSFVILIQCNFFYYDKTAECHGICKNLQQSEGPRIKLQQINFPSNLNYGFNTASAMGLKRPHLNSILPSKMIYQQSC